MAKISNESLHLQDIANRRVAFEEFNRAIKACDNVRASWQRQTAAATMREMIEKLEAEFVADCTDRAEELIKKYWSNEGLSHWSEWRELAELGFAITTPGFALNDAGNGMLMDLRRAHPAGTPWPSHS